MILLSTIINTFEDKFLARYKQSILPSHEKALQVMKNCRTEASPHMLVQCTDHDCQQYSFIPHSCGHRNCPHCQSHEGQQWIDNQLSKQLPAEYYLITFTLPYQLRDLAWWNQKLVYTLFFFCVQNILKTFTQNDKKLKGMAGFTAILHTHSRELNFHPHIHVVIPGASINKKPDYGGLNPANISSTIRHWQKCSGQNCLRKWLIANYRFQRIVPKNGWLIVKTWAMATRH